MKATPVILFLISTATFISVSARSENTPLLTVFGKDFTRETVNLNVEPSESAQKSIAKSFPGGLPANWAECSRIGEALRTVLPAIQNKFIEDNNLKPSEQDIADYMKRVEMDVILPGGNIETVVLDAEGQQMMEGQAIYDLSVWKFNIAVFEKYGGRISDRTYGSHSSEIMRTITPMDAICFQLKDAEANGLFTIHDDDLRAIFWTCITNFPGTQLSVEEGNAALYKHPADAFKASIMKSMSNMTARVKSEITHEARESDTNKEIKDSEQEP